VTEKRMLIDPNYPGLSIEAQCEALGLSRSSYYYAPIPASEENIALMKRVEEIHYDRPEYGYRKIHATLRREGIKVNEKRIERLWTELGFQSILPKKNLSQPSPQHAKYSYLLNGMWIGAPNQVFSTDITFLPMVKGFVYLATITDWFSRFVLSYEISNTLTVDFCLAALERALKIARPKYFNMDQGSQFTSTAYLEILERHGIKISMDGKGRCIDNIYQERSWWSLKYEELYPNPPAGVPAVWKQTESYYLHFNQTRPHEALLYATPHEIYYGITPKYSKGLYSGFEVKRAKK